MFATDQPMAQPPTDHITPLCHLSTYDIYVPGSIMKPRLKPPERFCFGIKSQNSYTTTETRENFVQFFSTNNGQLAYRFHELVHQWRSWYLLVNQKTGSARPNAVDTTIRRGSSQPTYLGGDNHNKRSTITSSSFGRLILPLDARQFPLADHERLDIPVAPFDADRTPTQGGKPHDTTEQSVPPVSMSIIPASPTAGSSKEGSVFHPGTPRDKSSQALPTQPMAKSWFPSATEHTARTRALSKRSRRCTAASRVPPARRNGKRRSAYSKMAAFSGHVCHRPSPREHGVGFNPPILLDTLNQRKQRQHLLSHTLKHRNHLGGQHKEACFPIVPQMPSHSEPVWT